ncbi:hypothetical protein MPSEU_000546000 [Mayamaea pseudoterrestris]|nr:hypothetical protein MPSEU_000546000 [Mayamaea pseudoterrestris]
MSASNLLSTGSVLRMSDPAMGRAPPDFVPTVQVLSVKPIPSPNGDRFRLVISDGVYFINGMLATQLNELVGGPSGLQENCIVRLEEFMNNKVGGKIVVVVLRLSVIQQMHERIGSATDVGKVVDAHGGGGNAATSMPAAAARVTPASNSGSSSHNPYGGGNNPIGHSAVPMHNAYARPTSSHSSSAPIQVVSPQANQGGGMHLTPIAGLNMYNNRWTIRARVTTKSDIRTWRNAKGEGSLFSLELLDDSNVDIRATLFKEAVDKFYPLIQVGKVYRISGGRLKIADTKWNTCKSPYEMTLDQNSEIHLDNDVGNIPTMHYEFTHKIADLEQVTDTTKHIDVLAVVKSVQEPVNLISKKSGQELTKCDLVLVDDSNTEIMLTLWGDKARNAPHEYANQPVVAIRRARVSDYSGKSLSADVIIVNPEIPQASQLADWWNRAGRSNSSSVRSLTAAGGSGGKVETFENRKCIASIKEENLGHGNPDKPDWITFKGTITFIKRDKEGGAWYPACPNAGEPCKNRYKVSTTTDGQWYCDKCQGSFPNCVRRWIFSATVQDDTSSTWVSFFNEQAEQLLGVTADEVYAKSNTSGGFEQDTYDSFFAKALYTEWIFKCKIKNEMVNEESRVKASVVTLVPVDYARESLDMLAAIEKF